MPKVCPGTHLSYHLSNIFNPHTCICSNTLPNVSTLGRELHSVGFRIRTSLPEKFNLTKKLIVKRIIQKIRYHSEDVTSICSIIYNFHTPKESISLYGQFYCNFIPTTYTILYNIHHIFIEILLIGLFGHKVIAGCKNYLFLGIWYSGRQFDRNYVISVATVSVAAVMTKSFLKIKIAIKTQDF